MKMNANGPRWPDAKDERATAQPCVPAPLMDKTKIRILAVALTGGGNEGYGHVCLAAFKV